MPKRAKTISKREKMMDNNQQLPHEHGDESHTRFVRQHLGKIEDFQKISDVFKQLGDPTRIRIFWLLCHCEECVLNIAALLDLSSPAVSHHLKNLRYSGLICSRREGKEVFYRATDNQTSKLLHEMIEEVMNLTCEDWRVLHDEY